MKPRFSNQRNHALTLIEVVVVLFLLAIVVAIILPALARPKSHHGLTCVNYLKQIGLAYKIWAGDNNTKYPMEISVTNGGTMELAATGSAVGTFQIMSNELSTPKILVCQQDKEHVVATNFSAGFTGKNISYFVGLDAKEGNPQSILSGDDNFEIGGVPVKSGLCSISTNAICFWSTARHNRCGNILLADGSVQQLTNPGFTNLFQQIGATTNRLAIP